MRRAWSSRGCASWSRWTGRSGSTIGTASPRRGRGSHAQVMRGLAALRSVDPDPRIIAVISQPADVGEAIRFFVSEGLSHVKINPVLSRRSRGGDGRQRARRAHGGDGGRVLRGGEDDRRPQPAPARTAALRGEHRGADGARDPRRAAADDGGRLDAARSTSSAASGRTPVVGVSRTWRSPPPC